MSISLQSISKRFGPQYAVRDLSFEVNKGEICGFLGPNGAGKTTTMKMISGVLTPTSGQIRVNGLDVANDPMKVKRELGYLPEHNPLYTQMYVREYLRFVGKLHKVPSLRTRVDEMIERTGLTREQHKRIHMLSKGYRQRVGLAQAMIHDPSVLILDEPISGLDPNQLVDIRKLIKEIAQDKTVLFSSHILQEVEAVCDRVVIIHQGQKTSDQSIAEMRGGGKDVQVRLAFDGEVDLAEIKRLDEVRALAPVDDHILVELSDSLAGRKAISSLAVSKGWLILEMTPEAKKIESLFYELTNPQDK